MDKKLDIIKKLVESRKNAADVKIAAHLLHSMYPEVNEELCGIVYYNIPMTYIRDYFESYYSGEERLLIDPLFDKHKKYINKSWATGGETRFNLRRK